MILPIGHENQSVRRLPWVTILIMVLCFVIHIFISRSMSKVEAQIERDVREMFTYFIKHPYLEFDPEFKDKLFPDEDVEQIFSAFLPKGDENLPIDDETLDNEQAELDRLTDKILKTLEDVPFNKYGMIPTEKSLDTMFSHMFIHGDWFHLIFNLLFLYLTGPFIEDAWGKLIYIPFYLVAGFFSAMMFAVHYSKSPVPLIGASGAIAGVMGAFLVRYWNVKIKFGVYLFYFLIRGSFSAPAWAMLPLWFGLELLNAKVMDAVLPGEGSGVAHWAHVWGFVFGVVIGFLIKFLRIEEKYVHPKIEEKTGYVDKGYSKFEEARKILEEGRDEEAFALMLQASRESPGDAEIGETLWNLGVHLGRDREVMGPFTRLIEMEIKSGEFEPALYHFHQLREKIPGARLGDLSNLMLIERMIEREEYGQAKEMIEELSPAITGNSPPGVLMRFAGAALVLESPAAERVAGIVMTHPDIPEAGKEEMKTKFGVARRKSEMIKMDREARGEAKVEKKSPEETLDSLLGSIGEDKTPIEPRRESPGRKITPTSAIPRAFKKDRVVMEVEGMGARSLSFNRLRGIAFVKIAPPGGSPSLLIDFLLDDPVAPGTELRTLRVSSKNFDPVKFVPNAGDLREAYKALMNYMLKASGARAWPDRESVLLEKKLPVYLSIQEYEQSLLAQLQELSRN